MDIDSFIVYIKTDDIYKDIAEDVETIYILHYITIYVLLPDQISMPGCLYFVRYWAYVYCNYLLTRL